jgi:hypothetical protein
MARRSSKKMHFALKIIHSLLPVAFQVVVDHSSHYYTAKQSPTLSIHLTKEVEEAHQLLLTQ